MQDKPNASLSNQDVCEIIQELDNLIKGESDSQSELDVLSTYHLSSLMKQIAYIKARNLILSKI